ncbi:MAG: transcription antitermination factor NusB [Nannocystaceae bacterium]|nr:transcription antitermination factor NusB [Nannocystaceae bacterium]
MSAATDRDRRRASRELALAVLCHLESYPAAEHAAAARVVLDAPPSGEGEGEDAFATLAGDAAARGFAEELVALWREHHVEVDRLIEETSRSWRLSRMDRVDRNIVRLATTELLARADVPRAAVLSEAVRLASRYGSERSAAFVNGLVEALAKRLRPAGDGGATGEPGAGA